VDERVRSVVCKSSGRYKTSACGQTAVRQVVVDWTRLWRDGVGSGAACHELVCDSHDLSHVHLTNPCLLNTTKLVMVELFGIPNFALVRSSDVQVHPNTSRIAWPKRLY
jgi:hypothetical protein